MLLVLGQQTAFAAIEDTVKVCPAPADTVVVKKPDCCPDSTVQDHTSAYHKIVKEGGEQGAGIGTGVTSSQAFGI